MSLPSPQPGVLSTDYSSCGYSWTAQALNGVSWSKHGPVEAHKSFLVFVTRGAQAALGMLLDNDPVLISNSLKRCYRFAKRLSLRVNSRKIERFAK